MEQWHDCGRVCLYTGRHFLMLYQLNNLKKITEEHFKKSELDKMLTMGRQTGFYEMVNLLIEKNKSNTIQKG